jgi:hypothetical protein
MAAQSAPLPIPVPKTTSREYLFEAAQLLSTHLRQIGIDHAYIGGFAWSLLGSQRATQISLCSSHASGAVMIPSDIMSNTISMS